MSEHISYSSAEVMKIIELNRHLSGYVLIKNNVKILVSLPLVHMQNKLIHIRDLNKNLQIMYFL